MSFSCASVRCLCSFRRAIVAPAPATPLTWQGYMSFYCDLVIARVRLRQFGHAPEVAADVGAEDAPGGFQVGSV